MISRHLSCIVIALLFCLGTNSYGQDGTRKRLAAEVKPLLSVLGGKDKEAGIGATVNTMIDGKPASVDIRVVRFDDTSFDLDVKHTQYSVAIRRRRDGTAFALPHHKVVFIGHGKSDPIDHLEPRGVVGRLVSPLSMASVYMTLLTTTDTSVFALGITQLAQIKFNAETARWTAGSNISFQLGHKDELLDLRAGQTTIVIRREAVGPAASVDHWPGFSAVSIARPELERQLARGVRRASEILAPAPLLTNPPQTGHQVDHGELRWVEGQRVVLLEGTPEQIGTAHGQLLGEEAIRCVDSVLYSFGTVQTILTGRWFRHDLDQAYSRLAKHIPEDHKQETRALAASLEIDERLAEAVNVFPEMFHCSGFAIFGSATKDGKLYHGRVLDYMTTIGLQDAATTFIIAPKGKIAFANVGYGGFIGSVSGMNTKAISLGEMGGRGEGKWDGVPMATLMRRALEECSTLDEVIDLWKNNPRTCEYYYVFADGKSNRAVGVAAYPESVEFVQPGESHPRLGDGIKDAVVLSAGSRLEELRRRVTSLHGRIDAQSAQWLMSRPVAMQSNLHNVLFVPADGVLFVANADHQLPAADRPYVRLDLNNLLQSMKQSAPTAATGPEK